MSLEDLMIKLAGGAGSGNFGHSGRPGKRGGSAGGGKGGGGSSVIPKDPKSSFSKVQQQVGGESSKVFNSWSHSIEGNKKNDVGKALESQGYKKVEGQSKENSDWYQGEGHRVKVQYVPQSGITVSSEYKDSTRDKVQEMAFGKTQKPTVPGRRRNR